MLGKNRNDISFNGNEEDDGREYCLWDTLKSFNFRKSANTQGVSYGSARY